jgi:hypothetical protein
MVFWVKPPCSSETARRFGGTNRLNIQCRRVNKARCQQKQAAVLLGLRMNFQYGGNILSSKRKVVFEIHCGVTQNTVLCKDTANLAFVL